MHGRTSFEKRSECYRVTQNDRGSYHRVNIDGMAKLDGDLDCFSLSVNGTLKIYGSLTSESTTVNGMAKVEGQCALSPLM